MNSRLELPALGERKRHHRRSVTSGERRSPSLVTGTASSARMTAPTRREGYFLSRHASKSTTALGTANGRRDFVRVLDRSDSQTM